MVGAVVAICCQVSKIHAIKLSTPDLLYERVTLTFKLDMNIIKACVSVKFDCDVTLDSIQCGVGMDIRVLLVVQHDIDGFFLSNHERLDC